MFFATGCVCTTASRGYAGGAGVGTWRCRSKAGCDRGCRAASAVGEHTGKRIRTVRGWNGETGGDKAVEHAQDGEEAGTEGER